QSPLASIGRKARCWGALLAASSLCLVSAPSRAQSLLLGGAPPPMPSAAPVDEALPRGALRRVLPRPTGTVRLSTWRRPVCVAAPPRRPGDLQDERLPHQGRLAVTALERAYETLVLLRGYPPPAPSETANGELVWYLERPLDDVSTPRWG